MKEITFASNSRLEKLTRNPLFHATLVGLLICVFLFPDAIFCRAGLSQISTIEAFRIKQPLAQFYPQPSFRKPADAFFDAGGALYQSEPAQQFMRYCLENGESPYWNPYSGAGQLGPETLVDLKFSFFSFMNAICGGSQSAFNILLITQNFIGVSALYLLCVKHLKLSGLATIACCVAFAFNGFNTSTMGANTAQTYCYFPLLLFCLVNFATLPNTRRLAAITIVDAIILSSTFLPTTFFLLVSVHLIALSITTTLKNVDLKGILKITFWQGCALFLAFLSLAFLYFPILESFKYTDAVEMYSKREFFHANINDLLSLFSCKHFWESYCATPASNLLSTSPVISGNQVCHFGVISFLIASCGLLAKEKNRTILVVASAIVVVSIGRVFGAPVVDQIVEITPGFRSLGEQYWFMAIACALPIAVGQSFDGLTKLSKQAIAAPAVMLAIILGEMFYIYLKCGFTIAPADYRLLCVGTLLLVAISGFILICVLSRVPKAAHIAGLLLVSLLSAELIFDLMYQRLLRTDPFLKPSFGVTTLKNVSKIDRVINLNEGLIPAECGAAFQIQQIETMNMNILPTYERFFHRHFLQNGMPKWGRFCTFQNVVEIPKWTPTLNYPILNLMGVKYVVVSSYWPKTRKALELAGYSSIFNSVTWQIYKGKNTFPRAFAVNAFSKSGQITATDSDSLRNIAFTNDQQLIAAAKAIGLKEHLENSPVQGAEQNKISITSYHHDRVTVIASLKAPSLVILTDNWHPNWKAKINDKDVYIGLVDETFRGMALPAGNHKIEMRYRPESLSIAQVLSVASLLVIVLLVLFNIRIISTKERVLL